MRSIGHHASKLTDPDEIYLWNQILENQGKQFTTSGRGSRPGIQFTYTISTNADGTPGAEMFVSTRSKSITRSTIMLAYRKVRAMTIVSGPKSIGVHGDSYIFAIFKVLGVINTNQINEDFPYDIIDELKKEYELTSAIEEDDEA